MAENDQKPARPEEDAPQRAVPPGAEPIAAPRRHRPGEESREDHQSRVRELNALTRRVNQLSQQLNANFNDPFTAPRSASKSARRWKKAARSGVGQPALPDEDLDPATGAVLTLPGVDSISEPIAPEEDDLADESDPTAEPSVISAKEGGPTRPTPARLRSPALRRGKRMGGGGGRSRASALLLGQLFCFALLVGGFFLGRWSVPITNKPVAAPPLDPLPADAESKETALLSPTVFQRVNDILRASRRGDAAEARRLLTDAQSRRAELPGIDYRLALAALQTRDMAEMAYRIKRAVAANEQAAAAYFLRAWNFANGGDFTRVAAQMEKAAHADPFNARYFFAWGEALRRAGRPADAIEPLELALLRPCDAADFDYISYKLRLARIEANQGAELAADLSDKIHADPAPGDWLLTAAALNIQHSDFPAAAALLQRAKTALPPEVFNQHMRDYLFSSLTLQKEITPFLNAKLSEKPAQRSAAPLAFDPLSWSLPEADPSAWTPPSNTSVSTATPNNAPAKPPEPPRAADAAPF